MLEKLKLRLKVLSTKFENYRAGPFHLHVANWERFLLTFPDQTKADYLRNGINNGFPSHYNHSQPPPNSLNNSKMNVDGQISLYKAIIKELENQSEAVIDKKVPFPFSTADEMLDLSKKNKISISEMKRQNELVFISKEKLKKGISELWNTMSNSINSGLKRDGVLPGGLNVRRRAKSIFDSLNSEIGSNTIAPHIINDWISLYAMAVNEENAAGGKIVTAPTNGAAGVIPATFMYYLNHVPNADPKKIEDYLLTAAAIGGILKSNASISGAEVGCQGEVGSASAMAAGALCAILGGNSLQIENAAEIALEHHLGMTCDPIKGLVQAPCIERNGLGAIKAVSAASLSLRGDGIHLVSLDACIKTMFETGKDMMEKYKETSKGGLAVNVIEC